jgi:hypothetical protein
VPPPDLFANRKSDERANSAPNVVYRRDHALERRRRCVKVLSELVGGATTTIFSTWPWSSCAQADTYMIPDMTP